MRSFRRTVIDDERELVAAEAVDGLAFGRTPLRDETVELLRRHPCPYVRGALLRYLARTRGPAAIDTLMAALKEDSHIIRENAVDELEELEAREAIPALRRLLDDSHQDVRTAARYALQTLADR